MTLSLPALAAAVPSLAAVPGALWVATPTPN